MTNSKQPASNRKRGPKVWSVLRKVKIGTHQTLQALLEDLPDRQVRITDQCVLNYETEHEQRDVKLVAPQVCQLGFSDGPVSAKEVINCGLNHQNLSRSPVAALVKLRQQYHDQPAGDTCIGSHHPIESKLLHLSRSTWSPRAIEAIPRREYKYGPDHRFIFEVYKNLRR
jgi:hypothetical protein